MMNLTELIVRLCRDLCLRGSQHVALLHRSWRPRHPAGQRKDVLRRCGPEQIRRSGSHCERYLSGTIALLVCMSSTTCGKSQDLTCNFHFNFNLIHANLFPNNLQLQLVYLLNPSLAVFGKTVALLWHVMSSV